MIDQETQLDNGVIEEELQRNEDMDERQSLDFEIEELKSALKTYKSKSKYLIIGYIGLFLFATVVFYSPLNTSLDSFYRQPGYFILLIAYISIIAVIIFLVYQFRSSKMQGEIDTLNARKRILFDLSAGREETPSYFDKLVNINIQNLAEYYTLVKVHTDNSFKTSLVSGIVGFILIISGLVVAFIDTPSAQTVAIISTAAGVIIEFITGIFFYLYNKTVIHLKDYHDSLLIVQNILLSFRIVEDITDEAMKANVINQMIGYLIGEKGLQDALSNPVAVENRT